MNNSTSICAECRMGGGAHKVSCSHAPITSHRIRPAFRGVQAGWEVTINGVVEWFALKADAEHALKTRGLLLSNEKRVCGPCPHGMGPLASDETCPWCQLERLRAALQLILPLAKGYSPPGQSESARRTCNEWIAAAEAQLSGDSSAPETSCELERLRELQEKALALDDAVAEFGIDKPQSQYIAEAYQKFHDVLHDGHGSPSAVETSADESTCYTEEIRDIREQSGKTQLTGWCVHLTTFDECPYGCTPETTEQGPRCDKCKGFRTWCSICRVWIRTCCTPFETCRCAQKANGEPTKPKPQCAHRWTVIGRVGFDPEPDQLCDYGCGVQWKDRKDEL